MRPEIEQELSHILLTELLAYQFASPVRWIETQDVFLKNHKTERVVEIGPSPTLAGMASRTIKAKYESFDAALSLQRQVLCYAKDAKEIYYTPDPEEAPEVAAPAPEVAAPAASAPAAAPAPAPAPAAASAAPVAAAPDAPVPAALILQTLVAHKLKKPLDGIPMGKAIKDLVNGKSTVQNEILGDLGKEFGSTPEKPEDTPLEELAEQFQDSFNGQLGKTSSSLISRMMSSKMPGGFSITVARKYLELRYGFGPGRQDAVLLMALASEPAARLPSDAEAKQFLDTHAQKHATAAGILLASASSGGDSGATGGAVVDTAALDAVTAENKKLAKQQLEVLARYLQVDLSKGAKSFVKEKEASAVLQKELDLWEAEHGEYYARGVRPVFSRMKARTYDSYWNWARQDVLLMYYDIIFGQLTSVDRETINQCIQLMNRASPSLIEFMQYHVDHVPEYKGETYQLARRLGQQLIDNCKQVLDQDPVYKDVSRITGPKTTVDAKGTIVYTEAHKESVRKFEQYVYEMAQGGPMTRREHRTVEEDLARVYKAISRQASVTKGTRAELDKLYKQLTDFITQSQEIETAHATKTLLSGKTGKAVDDYSASDETPSASDDEIASLPDRTSILQPVSLTIPPQTLPFLHLQTQSSGGNWEYHHKLSCMYLDGLESGAVNGLTFRDKYVLITGAGAGSIGAEILQGLIAGGARVVVTTLRFSKKVTEYYQSMYSRYGSSGSQLVVVPFNQGSVQDVEALVSYIYDKKAGLGWDLDAIIPFAAIPENGNGLDNIDSKSELAHRIMLTNVLRLLGAVKAKKLSDTRPAQVILPLSPNHGTFGFDGMYSESKIALETLFNRWSSEDWGAKLTVCGAIIGWTRGTGLMSANNIIAEGIEKMGVRTFSQKEMAFNILGLMTPQVAQVCQEQPVMADLNGGLQFIDNLKAFTSKLRGDLVQLADVRRAVSIELAIEHKVVHGDGADAHYAPVKVQPRANMTFAFPDMKPYSEIKAAAPDLEGMLDLESVIVVSGFAEVGPWGNARTRWEMEAFGEFSLEGCIEMAWIMGLIKYHNGPLKGKPYAGWVDSKTQQPVEDKDVKKKYEEEILAHAGIRLIEPELFHGYDPQRKQMIQEVVIQHDLEPFEASRDTAEQYKHQHGDKCDIFEEESGEYTVRILKGATLYVPKALRFDRLVAGQIPSGWDARHYGISEDTISQVDPITLYVLVSTVEALLAAGITDPYEFYKYVHVSEVGNCSGSGMGGVLALRGMFKDRFQDQPVQNDILQESFINTMSAWVNMLLLSLSGPIKTPVGACATAVESVDVGVETIHSGKAKVCIVGGYDDFQEEGSYEFANMNATSNALDEFAHGRTPSEMSRPATTTRNGFMEAQGSGIQVIMTADLALKMGVPIYAVVAMTATASDKIGRSVPAPGKGILTTAREYHLGSTPGTTSTGSGSKANAGAVGVRHPTALNILYRNKQLKRRLSQIAAWEESEMAAISEEAELAREEFGPDFSHEDFVTQRAEEIHRDAHRQVSDAKRQWGNEFYKSDPRIAPLRGALATFGLTIDDLGVASFHGTSTKANDKNESATINEMMRHLGRSEGNPVLGVFQKYLTGHPKGAAGAWMLNGAIQMLNSGIVPGNRNADNVDAVLQDYDYVLYPSRSIQTDGIKAVSVTSFGFGQKGAQAVVVHPDYLYAVLDRHTYEDYAVRVNARNKRAYRYMHNAITRNTMFAAKDKPPYAEDLEQPVYLDPLARVDAQKDGSLQFNKTAVQNSKSYLTDCARDTATSLASLNGSSKGVGVDVELLSALNLENDTFIERNFTAAEQTYAASSPNPRASFTGNWSAKEAVFKALGVRSKGAGAALNEIEILRSANGQPQVTLHGDAKKAADAAGVKNVTVLISHDDFQATAVALSEF